MDTGCLTQDEMDRLLMKGLAERPVPTEEQLLKLINWGHTARCWGVLLDLVLSGEVGVQWSGARGDWEFYAKERGPAAAVVEAERLLGHRDPRGGGLPF